MCVFIKLYITTQSGPVILVILCHPMTYGGFIMDAAEQLGRNPVSKHQIQPGYGDEQADAGRDG